MEAAVFIFTLLFYCLLWSAFAASESQFMPDIPFKNGIGDIYDGSGVHKLLHTSFPSEADTLAYVDALKHSNFSQWRSLEEVAKLAGGGSCSGAVNTSVLTALYLLGLFNLCAASPASCCIPPHADRRRRRSFIPNRTEKAELPQLLDSLKLNLSNLSLEQFSDLPHVSSPDGGRIPVHISVVEQVRKLWDSNPRLLSNISCRTATEAVRSSFISLSGVASGIILAYSIAQLNRCYPDHRQKDHYQNIWFFPIPRQTRIQKQQKVRSLPPEMPVKGDDDPDDGCERSSVRMEIGECVKVFSSEVCPYMSWVLFNQETGKGECVPRLCTNGKVFVEYDQMCHDVNEPGFCPERQRLYLTAWGEAVCDCIDGTFYGPDGNCHSLYEQAYCYKGTVLQFHKPSKTLVCKADSCQNLNRNILDGDLPYAKDDEGVCYQFSSSGPCETDQLYGFDIEALKPACVSLEQAGITRPPKSYQYSHMSFPSSTDASVPHYEVSYVILNGSTWELMMKTVGREKRDVEDDEKKIIPFLDTREFPTRMEEIQPVLQELNLFEELGQQIKIKSGNKGTLKEVNTQPKSLLDSTEINLLEYQFAKEDKQEKELTEARQEISIENKSTVSSGMLDKKNTNLNAKLKIKNRNQMKEKTKAGKKRKRKGKKTLNNKNYRRKTNKEIKTKNWNTKRQRKSSLKQFNHDDIKSVVGEYDEVASKSLTGYGGSPSSHDIEIKIETIPIDKTEKLLKILEDQDSPNQSLNPILDTNLQISSQETHLHNSSQETHLHNSIQENYLHNPIQENHFQSSGQETHFQNSGQKIHLRNSKQENHLQSSSQELHSQNSSQENNNSPENVEAKVTDSNTRNNPILDIPKEPKKFTNVYYNKNGDFEDSGHNIDNVSTNKDHLFPKEVGNKTEVQLDTTPLDFSNLAKVSQNFIPRISIVAENKVTDFVLDNAFQVPYFSNTNSYEFENPEENTSINLNENNVVTTEPSIDNPDINVTENFSDNPHINVSKKFSDNPHINVSENFSDNNPHINVSKFFSDNPDINAGKNFSDNHHINVSENFSDNLDMNVSKNIRVMNVANLREYSKDQTVQFDIIREAKYNKSKVNLSELNVNNVNEYQTTPLNNYGGIAISNINTIDSEEKNGTANAAYNNNTNIAITRTTLSKFRSNAHIAITKKTDIEPEQISVSLKNSDNNNLHRRSNKSQVKANFTEQLKINETDLIISKINSSYVGENASDYLNEKIVMPETNSINIKFPTLKKYHISNSSSLKSSHASVEYAQYCNTSDINMLKKIADKLKDDIVQPEDHSDGKYNFQNMSSTNNESAPLPGNVTVVEASLTSERNNTSKTPDISSGLQLYFNEDKEQATPKEDNRIQLIVEKRLKQISHEPAIKQKSNERDLHKKDGIIKVHQTILKPSSKMPSTVPQYKRTPLRTTKKKTGKGRTKEQGIKKIGKGKKGRKQKKSEKRRKNEVLQLIKEDVGQSGTLIDDNSEKSSMATYGNFTEKQNKSIQERNLEEDSLPEYLRNRDRRQAGSKRGGKTSPGIINAPLLNQCRPGAKRDYNGHCRPKVIPEDNVPAPRRAKGLSSKPSLPRIKCEGTSRLDSRGTCRTTFSGLG